MSQAQSSLKVQKRQLKDFIFERQARIFMKCLISYKQSRTINEICKKVHNSRLMKLSFDILRQNCGEQQRLRQMQDYYEEISQNQVEDDYTVFYFNKSNLLNRYFKKLKDNRRAGKLGKVVEGSFMKLVFRSLQFYSLESKRSAQILNRWKEHQVRKLVFKYFNNWKQYHRNTCGHYQQLKYYRLVKQKQIIGACFSALKLDFKRTLVKTLKAERYQNEVLKDKAFNGLRLVTEEGGQFRAKEFTLHQYLLFKRTNQFMDRFLVSYDDIIDYQRLSVKEQRLRRLLVGMRGVNGLRHWRRKNMKKDAYKAIESKLIRLKQKQKKRQIFQLWMNRVHNRNDSPSPTSDHHKRWLVNYYSGLCQILPHN